MKFQNERVFLVYKLATVTEMLFKPGSKFKALPCFSYDKSLKL